VRGGDGAQLGVGLGQRHIQDRLPAGGGGAQHLQRQRRLARARHALDEEEAISRQAATQHVVQPGHTRRSVFRDL
jgi:hypothetical protein